MNTIISETYRFKDEKSDKFWRIEYTNTELVTNHGKIGTIGKYKVKEFDNEEKCKKEVLKLIDVKKKKGYIPFPEFDIENHIFIDDEEIGLHMLTSHPKFREHFTREIYYDCGSEDAPFGSDEGDTSLHELEKEIRKKKKAFSMPKFIKAIKEVYESWSIPLPYSNISSNEIKEKLEELGEKIGECFLCDVTAFATAFAEIKITGKLDSELKTLALNALKRTKITAEILEWDEDGIENISNMESDLENF